ncbi:MAG: HAMP domain-containing protein, partial [Anaerolineales bacterium]
MNPMKVLKSHLGAKFTLIFLFLAVLPIVGVGLIAYATAQPALEQNVINRLSTITLLKDSTVNRWIKDNQEILSAIAQRPLVRENTAVLTEMEGQTGPEFDILRENLLDDHLLPSVMGSSGLQDLIIIRASDGLIIVSSNESLEGMYRESEEFFIQGKQYTYVQHPVYDLSSGEGIMHISTPVKDNLGQVIAVLVGHSNLAELSDIMEQRSGMSQTEESYLVNISNLLMTKSRFITGAVLVKSIFSEGVSTCLTGASGSGYYDDYRGVAVVGVYHWMDEFEMCIITEEDQAEAFSVINRMSSTILLAVVVTLAISLVLGLIMTRSITQPLSQLVESSVEIGGGNLDYRIEVKGSDEISHLALALNQMAASLQLITASRDELNKEIAVRRKAEVKLSIKDFAFESSSSADSISSNDGLLTYANPSFARLWGYENADEIIGKPILDFFADSNESLEIIESITNTGKWSGEYIALRKDGSTFIAQSYANAIIDDEGNPTALYSSVLDITER